MGSFSFYLEFHLEIVMSNDTTLNLEFRHKKKSYLEDVQKYLEEKKKRWSKLENSGKEMSVLMKKVGVQSPNQLVTWGFNFENITKSEGEYVLSADTWANQNSFNTHVTGSEGELADLLVNFPELIIKGTYEDEYGRGSINQSEQEEEESKEENDEDDGDDEDSASNDDENGDDESEEEEEEQNDMPLSSKQDSKKQIKGYRFTKDFNVNAIDYEKELNLEMVLIPAGTFMMGSPESEEDRYSNETQHKVTLTKPFYLGKFTITQEQWKLLMRKSPGGWSLPKGDHLPITYLSWVDCQEFIKKLNASTKGGYRLPTEAEWEYACRAGTKTMYSFGDEITPNNANYDDSDKGKPVTGGSYKPNAFGLYDMHGNVWEWCEEWFGDYPTGEVTDPQGPPIGESRILRGGSFDFSGSFARSAMRSNLKQGGRIQGGGFRLARTI
jgi:formylglycine-generating enzyme required for sulfatase activity